MSAITKRYLHQDKVKMMKFQVKISLKDQSQNCIGSKSSKPTTPPPTKKPRYLTTTSSPYKGKYKYEDFVFHHPYEK